MKKIVIFILTAVFLCVSFGTVSFAVNDNLESETEDKIFSLLDSDTVQELEEIGIDSLDYSKIYNVSFSNITEFFSDTLSEKLKEVLGFLTALIGALTVISAVRLLNTEKGENSAFEIVSSAIIIMLTVGKLSPVINTVLSVLNLSSKFMLGYIPIFAGIVALSGNPSGALSYNTLTLAFAEGISAFSNKFAVSVIGAFYCLSISFSFNKSLNLSRLVSAFNKFMAVVLGLIASLFTALISIRGVMSVGLDTVSSKGIKFILSSMVPVVGGAIGEAYGAIVSSLGLIKSSVAVVGIIVSLVINIPALSTALIYYFSLSLLSFTAEIFNMTDESHLLKAFATGMKFLLLLLIYEMFILIISTGLMLVMKTSI